jgi:hypothetical protein
LLAPEPEPDAAAVEIARIEADARVTINDTDAAVRLAEIESRHNEEVTQCRLRIAELETSERALTLELSNLRLSILYAQETASNLAEAVTEVILETTESLTPPSTPENETLTEAGDESVEPVEVEVPAEVAAEEAVPPVVKRRRVIV